MLRKTLFAVAALLVSAFALPPIFFRLLPEKPPELPAPELLVEIPSGARMHVIERGAGPAVVLVHGLPGQAGDWRDTTDLLAGHGRHVLAVDRIGYGHSDARADGDFTFEGNARELLGLLEALDLRDATVVGWSYGGGTALVAAHQDPSRIARLVLIGSVGPGFAPSGSPEASAIVRGVFRWVRAVPPVGRAVQRAISADAFSDQAMPEWFLPALGANLLQDKTFDAFLQEGARIGEKPPPDSVGLGLPILVIHGDDDRLVPIEVGRALATNNPAVELLEIAGGSHMLPVTHALQVADAIARFSAPTPPAEPPAVPPDAETPADAPKSWTQSLALAGLDAQLASGARRGR